MSVAALRDILEDFVTSNALIVSPIAKRNYGLGFADGEAGGEAKALLRVLRSRGLTPTPDERARITGCTDIGQLDTWLDRAATVSSINDLFD